MANPQISTSTYADLIDLCIAAGVVPLLVGPPGVGKSSFLQDASDLNNLKYLDVRLTGKDAADIGGIPNFLDVKDAAGNVTGKVTSFIPTDLFPLKGVTPQDDLIKRDDNGAILYEKDGKTPQRYDGWLVNLEEFTSADEAVQSACYQLILDRQVGKFHLHDNVVLTACGNRAQDGAIASKVGTAIKSRVTTIEVVSEYKPWMAWAFNNGIHHYVTDYLSWKPEMLHLFDPRSDDLSFPCNRTWHKLSDIIYADNGKYTEAVHTLALGTIGKPAVEFKNFISYYAKLPKIADILKDPKKADVPTDAGERYAMCGVMTQAIVDNQKDHPKVAALMDYVERMDPEYQTVIIANSTRKNRRIGIVPSVNKWLTTNAALLSAAL